MIRISSFIGRLLPLLIGLFLLVPLALAQNGWQDLPNTVLHSICPPNNFQPAGGGMPPYSFADNCHSVVDAWSGAAVDTKRNRLLIWGGGHVGYEGNEAYALNLGSQPATMQRLNDPSIFDPTSCPEVNVADGTPPARHTYGGLVYLPRSDRMFAWEGVSYCGSSLRHTWTLDLATMTWHDMHPGGVDVTAGSGSVQGAQCVLDPTTTHETVICLDGNNKNLFRYDYTTNSWAALTSYGSTDVPLASGVVVDPAHKLIIFIGESNENTGNFQVKAIDISPKSNLAVQDWSAQVTGCSALNIDYPSLTYDPSINRVVAYPGSGNSVYIFDPITRACVGQSFPGGPAANKMSYGIFRRFAYFPAIGKYGAVNSALTDAYTFTLNATPVNGLGASTATCLDKDGDGYGVGPGCIGPDADDLDASVQTAAQAIAKYGTFTAFLNHLGYAPTHLWYLDYNHGADSGNITHCRDNAVSPCKTWNFMRTGVAPGDMVLFRQGAWPDQPAITVVNGAPGNPIIFMAYPGESALLDNRTKGGTSMNLGETSWIVVDGLKAAGGGSSATGCIAGDTLWTRTASTFHNDVFRNMELFACAQGLMFMNGLLSLVAENNLIHDTGPSTGQHCLYWGTYGTNSALLAGYDLVLRRNICYNAMYNGFHLNGMMSNVLVEQNLIYNAPISGISAQMGVSNSIFRGNIIIDAQNASLEFSNYNSGDCGQGITSEHCPHDQTGNTIENNTFYQSGNVAPTSATGSSCPSGIAFCNQANVYVLNWSVGELGDLGHNTFRNNIFVNFGSNNRYSELQYFNGNGDYSCNSICRGWLASTVFDHNIFFHADGAGGVGILSAGAGSDPSPYTCSTASAVTTMTNCITADPKFVAAAVAYWNSISSFNFRLQPSSPAAGSGGDTETEVYDLFGNAFVSPRSIGGYAAASSSSATGYSYSACDINHDGVLNISDVQLAINQVLGTNSCTTADLLQNSQCSVVDVQRVIQAVLGGPCIVGP
jgi:hypothetical protein